MKNYKIAILMLIFIVVLSACGGDASSSDANSTTSNQALAENLTLGEGQFYIIQSTGAITDTYTGENWGGEWATRRLFEDGAQDEYWTLRLGGNNGVDDTTVSSIHLAILKGIEPGDYPINEGSILNTPDADEPVKVMAIDVRYPDYQILNDKEEVNGVLTLESISDEGMSGSINATLSGEGGEVQLNAVFDVPVTGRLEQ